MGIHCLIMFIFTHNEIQLHVNKIQIQILHIPWLHTYIYITDYMIKVPFFIT